MLMRSILLVAMVSFGPRSDQNPPSVSRESQATAPTGTATITGVAAIDADGQRTPIRRARVNLQADANGTSQVTDTDTSGRFHVDHLAAGTYHAVVDKFGFVPIGHVPTFELKDGQSVNATLLMQRGAAIEGRHVTENGEPAIGLTVSAGRLAYGPYGKRVVAVRQTTTDDLGRYRVHTLPAGEYYLEVAPDPLRMMMSPAMPGPAPKPARTYYAGMPSGTPRLNEARVMAVDAGQQLSDVDFALTSAVMSTLTARVTTSSGAAPTSFSFRLQRVGAPPGDVRCRLGLSRPNDNGAECPNIPPGDYWVLVAAHPAANGPTEFSATRVTVEGQDIQGLAITTTLGVPIAGHVETEGGVPLPANLQIAALETEYEYPAPTPTVPGASATPPTVVGADGTLTVPSVAGPRLLRVNRLPQGWAVRGVWLGDTEISDTPITFAEVATPPLLRVVVTSRTGSVGGTVLDPASRPAAGWRVVVFVDDVRLWGARSRFIQTREVGADGRYGISGLLPRKYFVALVDALDDGAWEDPDVLARLQSSATPIVVTAGNVVTRDWRVR